MKKISSLIFILCLLGAGIGFTSCSSDIINTDSWTSGTEALFQSMKGNYQTYVTMPDNSRKQVKIAVADVATNSFGTVVRVSDFPIDLILSKLYPNDYQYVSSVNVDTYEAPIDSVGVGSGSVMYFKTNDEYTANLNFSFVREGVSHQAWAKISVQGMYSSTNNNLTFNFTVTDLVLDNVDKSSLTPYLFQAEGTKNSTSGNQ